jgi:hypothetical protein
MKKKISEWLVIHGAMNQLPPFPSLPSYRIAKIMRSLKPFRTDFDAEIKKLHEKHGKKQDDGRYTLTGAEQRALEKDAEPLLDAEEEIDVTGTPIFLSTITGVSISPPVMEILADFFEDK